MTLDRNLIVMSIAFFNIIFSCACVLFFYIKSEKYYMSIIYIYICYQLTRNTMTVVKKVMIL